MAQQQQQQQPHGEADISAADNDFLPVLTSETAHDTTTRPGSDSTRGPAADAGADKISAGFSAGSLARTIALPAPRLEKDFRMQARLEGKIALGQSCWGTRNWIGICGGEWSATWGKGTVVVSVSLTILLLPAFDELKSPLTILALSARRPGRPALDGEQVHLCGHAIPPRHG